MIRRLATLLLVAAAMLTLYATASFLTGFDDDFTASAFLAALCFMCAVMCDRAEYVRQLRIATRQQVWARRDLSAARDKGPARRRFCHEHGTTRLPVMGPPG